jgi:hypothetical protein
MIEDWFGGPPPGIDRDHFALAGAGDGGVLMDLRTGDFYALNQSAFYIWTRTLEGLTAARLRDDLAGRHGLAPDDASQAVAAALALPQDQVGPNEEALFDFHAGSDGSITAAFEGEAIVRVEPAAAHLVQLTQHQMDRGSRRILLRMLAARLLAAHGVLVLHGSCVAFRQTAVAFCGRSGAGKTTTARICAAEWRVPVLAEDMLAVWTSGGRSQAGTSGEARIDSWIEASERLLEAGPGSVVPYGNLLESVTASDKIALTAVVSLDTSRRRGDQLSLRPLAPAAALAELLRNTFVGSPAPEAWRRQLAQVRDLAASLPCFSAELPDGLARLTDALRSQTWMTALKVAPSGSAPSQA